MCSHRAAQSRRPPLGPLPCCGYECKFVQPLWRTVGRFLKKLKVELLYDPAIPLLCIYPEKMKTITLKDACTPDACIAALLTIAKTWKQFKSLSTDNWLEKMCHITTMEYYSTIKRITSCHLQQHG